MDIVDFEATKFQSKLNTMIENVIIKEKIDLTDSMFKVINLLNVILPINNNLKVESIFLDNFIYESIYAGTDQKLDDWRKIFDLLNNSQFSYKNYKQLATFYEKSGFTDRASEVIQKGEKLYLNSMPRYKRYPYEYLWGFLTGYGRDLTWAGIFILLFIVIGIFIFNPKYLKKENENGWQWLNIIKHKSYIYSKISDYSIFTRLSISLDQFIPGSPLGIGKSWEVSRVCFCQFFYYNMHKIAGWVLIPVILTALFTRLK